MSLKKKIAVAMSGGVDSSVAALILVEQGHDVTGVTMRLHGSAPDNLFRRRSIEDARLVCEKLRIKHAVADYTQDLEENVVAPFIAEYVNGRTPNPCVECNRTVKFGSLLDKLLSSGFDAMATGHYAGIEERDGCCFIRKAKDRRKDQSYFLYALRKEVLPRIVFPLADLTKDEVRSLARKNELPVVDQEESQDICFVPEGGLKAFLQGRSVEVDAGDIVHRDGRELGKHRGVASYTIGQRTGLGIAWPVPLYVLAIDAGQNKLIVGERDLLKADGLAADRVNLFCSSLPARAAVKIRYAHRGAKSTISLKGEMLRIMFEEAQEAVAPGQSAVLYSDDGRVLGGGIIKEVIFGNH
jgi:tRNA-specific 2-thiouridylase